MGLRVKQASSYKLGILSSLLLIAAVLAAPYYGVTPHVVLAQTDSVPSEVEESQNTSPAIAKYVRPGDNPIRIKVDKSENQFAYTVTTINGLMYRLDREECAEKNTFFECDIDNATEKQVGRETYSKWTPLVQGTYQAVTTKYTAYGDSYGNAQTDNFIVDSTKPSVSVTVENLVDGRVGRELKVAAVATDNSPIKDVNFYVTLPRSSDGECTANEAKIVESLQSSPAADGKYHATLNLSEQPSGDYCIVANAGDVAMHHAFAHQKIAVNTDGPIINFTGFLPPNVNKFTPDATVIGGNGLLTFDWTKDVLDSEVVVSDPNAETPVFDVMKDGTYTITLTVTDTLGNSTTVSQPLSYKAVPATPGSKTPTKPLADEKNTPLPFVAGYSVSFDTPGRDNFGLGAVGSANSSRFFGNANILDATQEDASAVEGLRISNDGASLFESKPTAAVVTASTNGWKLLGFAWYWWVLLLVVGVCGWWTLAGLRRRAQTQEF